LKTYNSTTDASATFISFRSDIAGISPTSNMGLIDNWAGLVNGSLVSLSANAIYTISATCISSNYYEATSTELTSYATDVIIALALNTTNSGTVALNINSLGTKTLQKIDVNGNVVNLDASELKKNKLYLFKYSGTSWVWLGATSADQISASGIANHLITISGCGVLIDSGLSASSISASSIIAYGEDGDLLMISGSGEYARIADSGISTYDLEYISASMLALSSGSYVVLSLNTDLSNEWLLTAGSGISLIQDTTASTIIINASDTLIGLDGWTYANATWGFVSASAMSIVDASSIISVGDKLKYSASGSIIYQYVIESSGSVVIVSGGSDYVVPNETITNNYYSHVETPIGFPQWFNWNPIFEGFSSDPVGTHKFHISGRLFSFIIYETSGSSDASSFKISLPLNSTTNCGFPFQAIDNNAAMANPGLCEITGSTISLYSTFNGGGWTTSGSKFARITGSYSI
jgi:hypothetical protein